MEGYDRDWVATGATQRLTSYTNLPWEDRLAAARIEPRGPMNPWIQEFLVECLRVDVEPRGVLFESVAASLKAATIHSTWLFIKEQLHPQPPTR